MLPKFCSSCCLGKIHKFPFSRSETVYTQPLQMIFTDLWGPAPVQSTNGYRYYIHFIDAYSRYTWIFMLRNKSEALKTFESFKNNVEHQLGFQIKDVQCDNGGEYKVFTKLLEEFGIEHRFSWLTTHEQNGTAERKHRHVVDNGLAMLATAGMPLKLWVKPIWL